MRRSSLEARKYSDGWRRPILRGTAETERNLDVDGSSVGEVLQIHRKLNEDLSAVAQEKRDNVRMPIVRSGDYGRALPREHSRLRRSRDEKRVAPSRVDRPAPRPRKPSNDARESCPGFVP